MKNVLVFKYGVSRGQNTYGYNIVSLYVDGKKVASECGWGYDMKGSALATWINYTFKSKLQELASEQLAEARTKTEQYYNDKGGGIYGLIVYGNYEPNKFEVHASGGTGMSQMKLILNALGYELEYITDTEKESVYQLHTQIN